MGLATHLLHHSLNGIYVTFGDGFEYRLCLCEERLSGSVKATGTYPPTFRLVRPCRLAHQTLDVLDGILLELRPLLVDLVQELVCLDVVVVGVDLVDKLEQSVHLCLGVLGTGQRLVYQGTHQALYGTRLLFSALALADVPLDLADEVLYALVRTGVERLIESHNQLVLNGCRLLLEPPVVFEQLLGLGSHRTLGWRHLLPLPQHLRIGQVLPLRVLLA